MMDSPKNINGDIASSAKYTHRMRPLTSRQERKLRDFLEENFLEITRNFKKRSEQTSSLTTLSAYLEATRRLLGVILQIPPIDPSAGLRIAYLLRLTGDALGAIPGYVLTPSTIKDSLQELIDFLDDLDQSWVAVLQGQVWDPEMAVGVDLILPIEDYGEPVLPFINMKSTPPSQTDIARLRSLLFAGESSLEEWLSIQRDPSGEEPPSGEELGDVPGMLARMGLLDDFDSLFVRTLNFLGGFSGTVSKNTLDPGEETMMV